jgi:hypothetical protein
LLSQTLPELGDDRDLATVTTMTMTETTDQWTCTIVIATGMFWPALACLGEILFVDLFPNEVIKIPA